MSKTITVPEADIQALRLAQFTIETGDPADDRAAASAFQRVLLGLGIEKKSEPVASIEIKMPERVLASGDAALLTPQAPRRGRPRKQRP